MNHNTQGSILCLGSHGYTGKLIANIAGNDGDWVFPFPEGASSGDWETYLEENLTEGMVVLSCLGPFADTWEPIVKRCLAKGAHYLDICAEWPVFEALRQLHSQAEERGVMLLPGVGFDVAATDSIAVHVARRIPNATLLQIGISGLERISRGSARTMLDFVGEPVRVRRNGRIVSDRRILQSEFDFGAGAKTAYAVSWGDISTAAHSTGIRNIEVYFEATPAVATMAFLNRNWGWVMQNSAVRRWSEEQVTRLPQYPRAGQTREVVAVARVRDDEGRLCESRLVTPEAYRFTASCAVEIAKAVAAGHSRPGFETPASLLGPDFVLGLEAVERFDSV